MSPLLQRIYTSEGGPEVLDTLMKYLNKGMSTAGGSGAKPGVSPTPTGGFSQVGGRSFGGGEGGGQIMSVLLSWHEKVVEVAGVGSVVRVMTDRRIV
jgi:actin related protein 2/3 complex subunit 5